MAIDVDAPTSASGILFILSVIALVVIAIFATSLGTILLGLVVVAVLAYLVYILGGRLHDSFRHGKPILRGRARKQSESGGDGDGR